MYQLPLAGRTARGKPIINLLPLEAGERINSMLPLSDYTENAYVFMATRFGVVKKVSLVDFSRPRSSGIIALELLPGDQLVGVDVTDGSNEVMLFTDVGKVIRFSESAVRAMGRTARGVRGIRLQSEQKVIALVVVKDDGDVLTATENGYGKRTAVSEYRTSGRGVQGVISIQVNERNGQVVYAEQVQAEDEVMLITDGGTLVRMSVQEISLISRNTQGVTLINLAKQEKLVGMQRLEEIESDSEEAELGEETTSS